MGVQHKKEDRRLLAEECSRLKARVNEVKGTIKETLESMDKLQAERNEANASKLVLENRAKTAKDQVTLLHCQILELQAQVKEARAASTRVIELEVKL